MTFEAITVTDSTLYHPSSSLESYAMGMMLQLYFGPIVLTDLAFSYLSLPEDEDSTFFYSMHVISMY